MPLKLFSVSDFSGEFQLTRDKGESDHASDLPLNRVEKYLTFTQLQAVFGLAFPDGGN
jgi:hypothetical protein